MNGDVPGLFSHSPEPSATGAAAALPVTLSFSHPTREAVGEPVTYSSAAIFSHPRGADAGATGPGERRGGGRADVTADGVSGRRGTGAGGTDG